MALINRSEYLEKLKILRDKQDLVKVITGARRCGKSVLLELFQNYLKTTGIADAQVISINFEDLINDELRDYKKLHQHIMKLIQSDKMTYVFLDEVQLVENWIKAVNSLRIKKGVDVYVTGSNANMMSGDLNNEFGGRWMEIKMLPLSFKEYAQGNIRSGKPLSDVYERYITESGFPQTVEFGGDQRIIGDYLRDTVFLNAIQRDIIGKYKLPDATKLNDTARFVFDNMGRPTSLLSIEKGLGQSGRKVDADTVGNYIKWLQDCFMLYKCERYDIKGRQLLSTNAKYYVVDCGLRYALLGHRDTDIGRTLENVVYLELLRRGYKVYAGKINKKKEIDGEEVALEVDFVAEKDGEKEYYQVSRSIIEEKTMKREYASLEEIKDGYPRYLLTMDARGGGQGSIKRLNALDWLLGTAN
ncbi:MAG: ATP-binding protein [Rickettsiales bacterium]|jgi:predicted AAA+ superfamily ATPase|nr:ATP-binding protein [Rickettsiales bacterium]